MFSTIDSHFLSSNKFVFAGTFPRFCSEPLLYMLLQKFRVGGKTHYRIMFLI